MKKQFTIFLILIFVLGLVPVNFSSATDLSNKLSGRILLQVEGVGQAWYIDPGTKQRAFLGRPADAFQIMRELGLGISEKDYNSFNGYAPQNLSGRILLRVEANGEAYYVNPTDLKMYYLGRPADAFKVMREKGLGITNEDLTTVPVFQKYKEQTEANTNAINSLSQIVEEQQKKISELENKINTNTSTSTTATTTTGCIEDKWVCGSWGSCSASGVKTRLCSISDDCGNVNTPSPVISQSCDYSPNACSSWAYSGWGSCSTNGQQTRTIISSLPSGCTGGSPTTTQSCSATSPTCTSWTYSSWGICSQAGSQSRTIISSLPSNCINGNPVLIQSCTPAPYFMAEITFDKDIIANDGVDSIKIKIITKDSAGTILPFKLVRVQNNTHSDKTENLTSDLNGIINTTITTTGLADSCSLAVTADYQSYFKTYQVINVRATLPFSLNTAPEVEAPAINEPLMLLVFDQSYSGIKQLKIEKIKFKIEGLTPDWITNIKLTKNEADDRFDVLPPVILPSTYSFSSDGSVIIIPSPSIEIYFNDILTVVADIKNNSSQKDGTGVKILEYAVIVNENAFEFSGSVNDRPGIIATDLYVDGRIKFTLPSRRTNRVITNYCWSEQTQQIVTCFDQ